MPKHIQDLNVKELASHLLRKGWQREKPFLLAMDCDRTLVDRSKGAHFISAEVIAMFQKFNTHPNFILAINTGRDWTSYQPLQAKLSHSQPCLFLAGRVLQHQNLSSVYPEALLPKVFCQAVWKKFIQGHIPFLDVKHREGNIFFAVKNRLMGAYYGSYRPVDWFKNIHIEECLVEQESNQEVNALSKFLKMDIVRLEIPLMCHENELLFQAVQKSDQKMMLKLFASFLNLTEKQLERMHVIPILPHPSRADLKDIFFIRLIIHNAFVNKGVGIRQLMQSLSLPEGNVICFGDSAGATASDAVIKTVLPKATLFITDDGDHQAQAKADFLIKGVSNNGVPEAVSLLDLLCRGDERYLLS